MSRTACTGTDQGARAHPGPRVGARRPEPAAAAPYAGTGARPGLLLAVCLAVAFGAVAEAQAARLTELRVGVHDDDRTRVVVETDASVEPDVRQTDEEIVLLLDAQSEARHVPAPKSPHVESVRVTPSAGTAGIEVRIRLRRPVALERFSLDGPPRLVLDLSPGAPQAAAATEDEGAAEDTEAEATPAGESDDSGAARTAAQEAPAGEDAAAGADPGAAEAERWSEGTEGSALVREDPEASEERELLEGGRMAATSPEAGDEGTGDSGDEAGTPSDPRVAERGDASTPRGAVPPPDARGGPLDFLPPPLNQPTTLAILAAILIGLFVLTRLRGRRAADDRLSPFDAAEAEEEATASGASGAPRPPAAGETGAEHASAGEEAPDDDDELPAPRVRTTGSAAPAGASAQPSMFDAPGGGAADEAAGDLETPAGPAPEDAGAVGGPAGSGSFDPPAAGSFDPRPAGAAGAAAASAASAAAIPGEEPAGPPGSGAELERRLGHLERQVEELLDEKERLERQVSAQTEELRVQRAAIARTQRVLRGMSRDDEASEPVPR